MKPNLIGGARKMLGLTQQNVADHLGLKLPTYVTKEKGQTSFTDEQKVALAKLFNWSPSEMNVYLYNGQLPIGSDAKW